MKTVVKRTANEIDTNIPLKIAARGKPVLNIIFRSNNTNLVTHKSTRNWNSNSEIQAGIYFKYNQKSNRYLMNLNKV